MSIVLCAEHGIPMWRDEEDRLYRCAESQRGCDVVYTDPEAFQRRSSATRKTSRGMRTGQSAGNDGTLGLLTGGVWARNARGPAVAGPQ